MSSISYRDAFLQKSTAPSSQTHSQPTQKAPKSDSMNSSLDWTVVQKSSKNKKQDKEPQQHSKKSPIPNAAVAPKPKGKILPKPSELSLNSYLNVLPTTAVLTKSVRRGEKTLESSLPNSKKSTEKSPATVGASNTNSKKQREKLPEPATTSLNSTKKSERPQAVLSNNSKKKQEPTAVLSHVQVKQSNEKSPPLPASNKKKNEKTVEAKVTLSSVKKRNEKITEVVLPSSKKKPEQGSTTIANLRPAQTEDHPRKSYVRKDKKKKWTKTKQALLKVREERYRELLEKKGIKTVENPELMRLWRKNERAKIDESFQEEAGSAGSSSDSSDSDEDEQDFDFIDPQADDQDTNKVNNENNNKNNNENNNKNNNENNNKNNNENNNKINNENNNKINNENNNKINNENNNKNNNENNRNEQTDDNSINNNNDDKTNENEPILTEVEELSNREIMTILETIPAQKKKRKYADYTITPELNEKVTDLLTKLAFFQTRMYVKDPVKAKTKKRFVNGLQEVLRSLQRKKVKAVVCVPDVEDCAGKGGLNELLESIFSQCRSQGVPLVFALTRKTLGQHLGKRTCKPSCAAILDHSGVDELMAEILALVKKLRQQASQAEREKVLKQEEDKRRREEKKRKKEEAQLKHQQLLLEHKMARQERERKAQLNREKNLIQRQSHNNNNHNNNNLHPYSDQNANFSPYQFHNEHPKPNLSPYAVPFTFEPSSTPQNNQLSHQSTQTSAALLSSTLSTQTSPTTTLSTLSTQTSPATTLSTSSSTPTTSLLATTLSTSTSTAVLPLSLPLSKIQPHLQNAQNVEQAQNFKGTAAASPSDSPSPSSSTVPRNQQGLSALAPVFIPSNTKF